MNDFYRQQEVYVYSAQLLWKWFFFSLFWTSKKIQKNVKENGKIAFIKNFLLPWIFHDNFFTSLPFFILTFMIYIFMISFSLTLSHFSHINQEWKLFFLHSFFCILFIIIDKNAARLVSCRNIIDLLLYMMTFLNNFVIILMWR